MTRSASTRLASCLALCALVNCGGNSSRYDLAMKRAENARTRGYPDEVRDQYEQAAELAKNDEDRAEALYRAATVRGAPGGRQTQIERLRQVRTQYPKTSRAARAQLDLARLLEKENQKTEAAEAYQDLIVSYPQSILASRALDALLQLWKDDGQAPSAMLAQLSAFENLGAGSLRELTLYRAACLEKTIDTGRAVERFEELAKEYPLPKGRYTDEALLESARLRLTLGDIDGSEALLKILAEAPARSLMVGSYERTSYAEAAFLRARIANEIRADRASAEQLFRSFPSSFPNSRLRDDAQFELVRLLSTNPQRQQACAALRELESIDPGSRFLRCLPVYCGAKGKAGEPPKDVPPLCERGLPPLLSPRDEPDSVEPDSDEPDSNKPS